jgi:small subunit ribosomal protein S20
VPLLYSKDLSLQDKKLLARIWLLNPDLPLTLHSITISFPLSKVTFGSIFMPNTKSAERRMRNSARKNLQNRTVKSRLHTLEKGYLELLGAGKKEEAAKSLRTITSAFDKAAKSGTIHRATADRKKSRLAIRLAKVG